MQWVLHLAREPLLTSAKSYLHGADVPCHGLMVCIHWLLPATHTCPLLARSSAL